MSLGLRQLKNTRQIGTMGRLLTIDNVIIAVVGLIAMGVIALRPKLFWTILVFVSVGAAGLMIQGYALVDEYLVGCVLIGGLLPISIGSRLSTEKTARWTVSVPYLGVLTNGCLYDFREHSRAFIVGRFETEPMDCLLPNVGHTFVCHF